MTEPTSRAEHLRTMIERAGDQSAGTSDDRPTNQILNDLRNQVAAITSKWMSTDERAAAALSLAELADTAIARLSEAARPLSIGDAVTIGMIQAAAQAGQRVARLVPDGEVLVGVARHIVVDDKVGAFHRAGIDDVRDCYLRVTPDSGIGEYFWPMSELIDEHQQATFVTGYQQS